MSTRGGYETEQALVAAFRERFELDGMVTVLTDLFTSIVSYKILK
jgi:hypothetical protein